MRHVMIVANQTLGGGHLRDAILKRVAMGPCSFTLLVPATPPHEHALWTEEEAESVARKRLEQALKRLGELEVELKGVVGDGNVLLAINDLLLRESFDEIILSTLPPGASRWIKQDLPHRVSRRFATPVTHIVAQPDLVVS